MAHFTSYDGAKLAYRRSGSGPPLVCLPGGPGLDPRYLGDLGGLGRSRELILPDIRGTGGSEAPADPAAYRCDRIARDVEALRAELSLERMDLLGHSAGGNVALLYAAAHPERIGHLILLAPGVRALGLAFTDEEQQAAMRRRSAESWFETAWAAAQAADDGDDSARTTLGYQPFLYGRWDNAALAHARAVLSDEAAPVRAGFYAGGAFDPPATRAALVTLTGPVLVYAGELDALAPPELLAQAAGLFPGWELTTQPGAGHFPWLDDPAQFAGALHAFLSGA
ncbi:MAG: alpha/beta fold hydrolase [Streptosporangiaceae bacterium]